MRHFTRVVSICTAALLWATASHGTGIKEDFSDGLAGWRTRGSVSVQEGAACLFVDGHQYDESMLYIESGVGVVGNRHELTWRFEFDFLLNFNDPSPNLPVSSFNVYRASNTEPAIDPWAIGGPLFRANFEGISPGGLGTIGPSSLGGDWLHYSWTFTAFNIYMSPFFELHTFAEDGRVEQVCVDNINFSPIPEPATLLLIGMGAFATLAREKIRTKRTGH